jgi:pimeloyl-ACP methyl ester carboxylesterase
MPALEVDSVDGVRLAVYRQGDPRAPTVIAIHGYPDNAGVWDGVAERLADRFQVLRYDVRGTGSSGKPPGRDAYLLDRLEADFTAVIDALSPDRPVHILAHDWGSVQAWHFVTSPALQGRIASFTSISGPALDHVGPWLRENLKHRAGLRKVLGQALHSNYIALFKLPWLAEAAWRTGLIDASLNRRDRLAPGYHRSWADKANGLQLYRANLLTRHRSAAGTRRRTEVPVQVLAPTADPFVSAAIQLEAPRPYVPNFYPRSIAGGHWILASQPAVIADAAAELIELVEYGRPSANLDGVSG